MTIKVKLREKPISGKRKSLYLDFYPAIPHPETGKPTRREFLGIYIDAKPRSPIEKTGNENAIKRAQQIRQKRENELNKPEVYSAYELELLKKQKKGERNFIEYFQELADKRKASNYDNWISAFHYLNEFTKGELPFADLNERFCNDFKDYLLKAPSRKSPEVKLSQNSAHSYFNKLKAALKQAFKDDLLDYDLNGRVKPIKAAETQRNYLTLEELNRLVSVDCKNPLMKRAALFSALTGLRFSDIQKLTWSEIEHSEMLGYQIRFRQKKTKGFETLPVSDQAVSLLGERRNSEDLILNGLKYSAHENKHLADWVRNAGIEKEITFHCFRHTYATLQLISGTDIYTVSKLLGHRELKTTQVYAKIVDQAKRDAANRIVIDL